MQIERLDITVVIPSTRIAAMARLLKSMNRSAVYSRCQPTSIILVSDNTPLSALRSFNCVPINVLHPRSLNVSYRRNLGSQFVDTKWILYLDDDVVLPIDYFARLWKEMNRDDLVDVIQGVAWRPVHSDSLIARLEAIHYVRTIRRDWRARQLGQLDPRNLIIKRETARAFPFDDRLAYGGEGHELLSRLQRSRITVCLRSSLAVYHDHRTKLCTVLHQKYRYGKGRAHLCHNRLLPQEPRSSITIFLKRHFGWTTKTFLRGGMSAGEWLYAICIYISFWLGFIVETTLAKFSRLERRNSSPVCINDEQFRVGSTSRRGAYRNDRLISNSNKCRKFWLQMNGCHSIIYEGDRREKPITANSLIWGDVYLTCHHLFRDLGSHTIPCINFDPPFSANECDSWESFASLKHYDYVAWLRARLVQCAELLSNDGVIWIHMSPVLAPVIRGIAHQLFANKYPVAEYHWHCNRPTSTVMKSFDYGLILCYGFPRGVYGQNDDCASFQQSSKIKSRKENGHYPNIIWNDIQVSFPNDRRRTYWIAPVKPRALMQRIIELGSRRGDLFLDCFTGTGIAVEVARNNSRTWIACDSRFRCIRTAAKRLAHPGKNNGNMTDQELMSFFTFY